MSDTGRYYVTDLKTGRKFCVEFIDNAQKPAVWGDLDPVTKKYTGSYGEKHKGSIHEQDSVINEENGFKNIIDLPAGKNPDDYINFLLNGGKTEDYKK
jgi:hypothetical protein